MARDLVSARFPGFDEGYESWFLRAAAPSGGQGFWIRYTVHRRKGEVPSASLWFTWFDAGTPAPVASKVTLTGPDPVGEDWVRIGAGAVGPGSAHGTIDVPDTVPVGWELTFSGNEPFAHLPRRWMYDAPLPRTKPVAVHPSATFEGQLVIGNHVISVDGWRGTVGHNWGSEHAERWIWLQAAAFDDDEDAWLDVVLARLRLGRWTTPWSGFGGLYVDGRLHRLGGLGRVRSTTVDEHPDHARFALTGGGAQVEGRVVAPNARTVGWEYADPEGGSHDVLHCTIADLELSVRRDDAPDCVLRTAGGAAYELGMREHDHGVLVQPFGDG